jgi:transposase
MRYAQGGELTAGGRRRREQVRLPAYAPDLNPVEGIWSVLKRGLLANLAVASFAHLVQVIRHGLKEIQYQPGLK